MPVGEHAARCLQCGAAANYTEDAQNNNERLDGVNGTMMAPNRKVVSFIRHGLAAHNFGGIIDPDPVTPDRYTDSPLTDYGRAQATCAAAEAAQLKPELLVCSPLSRALETGLRAFPHVPTCVAHEMCREYCAGRYANKRLSRTALAARFPSVDFSALSGDEDPIFRPDVPEAWPAGLQDRIVKFIHWVGCRPEKAIAVASHGVYIEVMLKMFDCLALGERIANCELRTVVLEWPAAAPVAGELPKLVSAELPVRPDPQRLQKELARLGITKKC